MRGTLYTLVCPGLSLQWIFVRNIVYSLVDELQLLGCKAMQSLLLVSQARPHHYFLPLKFY